MLFGGDLQHFPGPIGEKDRQVLRGQVHVARIQHVAHDLLGARLAWTTKGASAAAILAKAWAASLHSADMGRIVPRTDDDQVVLEPGCGSTA